ncbi:hypothetical protein FF38_12644 [Lucilia cuprina]|uniref:Uncharacterized protein n=1 Tax=Lucilia cuprina TaxID=7375 RepID=A0A0L0C4C3_LUCCU|nr:hypothetical protein FF38_12644 [Lucilia cuprina]
MYVYIGMVFIRFIWKKTIVFLFLKLNSTESTPKSRQTINYINIFYKYKNVYYYLYFHYELPVFNKYDFRWHIILIDFERMLKRHHNDGNGAGYIARTADFHIHILIDSYPSVFTEDTRTNTTVHFEKICKDSGSIFDRLVWLVVCLHYTLAEY